MSDAKKILLNIVMGKDRFAQIYPPKHKISSVENQVVLLKKVFPKLEVAATLEYIERVLPNLSLPADAEGWFAVVKPEKLGETYGKALMTVLAAMDECFPRGVLYEDYTADDLDRLARILPCKEMFMNATRGQNGDIVIIPAQLGLRHRGRSVAQARRMFSRSEFGLDSITTGCILITHTERLVYGGLGIDIPGDKSGSGPKWEGSGYFPSFFVCDADWEIVFNINDIDVHPNENFGSVSGFVPKLP